MIVVDDGAGDDETAEAGASAVGPDPEHPETAMTVSAALTAPKSAETGPEFITTPGVPTAPRARSTTLRPPGCGAAGNTTIGKATTGASHPRVRRCSTTTAAASAASPASVGRRCWCRPVRVAGALGWDAGSSPATPAGTRVASSPVASEALSGAGTSHWRILTSLHRRSRVSAVHRTHDGRTNRLDCNRGVWARIQWTTKGAITRSASMARTPVTRRHPPPAPCIEGPATRPRG